MTTRTGSKALHIALWAAQGLLAMAFGMAGLSKLTRPMDELAGMGMSFVAHYEPGMVRLIGFAEVLGALGLILPSALRRLPVLTPLAALGLALLMVGATHYHVTHNEPFAPTVVLMALCVFVAWGRYAKAPFRG